jgi:hypothetical protein
MRAYACSLSLAMVQRWHGMVPPPGSRLATTLIATTKPLPSGATQLFVVTASVTDSFEAKLNERLRTNATRWRLNEIRRSWRRIWSRSRRSTLAFVEAVAVQRRTQILDRRAAVLEKLVLLMQRRTAAGASSPSELTRAQAAIGMTRLERERAQRSDRCWRTQ